MSIDRNSGVVGGPPSEPSCLRFGSEYNMSHPKRGLAIIFNHQEFEFETYRNGTDIDRDRLSNTLKMLKFEVVIKNNSTKSEIMDEMKKTSKMNHKDSDCILIAVLTHGDVGDQLCAKDMSYSFEELWEPLTAKMCPDLAGKPKIFVVNACRGTKVDGMETDSAPIVRFRIPDCADFLFAFSTVPKYVSYRFTESGTPYIQALCEELNKNGIHYSVTDLLIFVQQKVACLEFNEANRNKQMPCTFHTLTRCLKFN